MSFIVVWLDQSISFGPLPLSRRPLQALSFAEVMIRACDVRSKDLPLCHKLVHSQSLSCYVYHALHDIYGRIYTSVMLSMWPVEDIEPLCDKAVKRSLPIRARARGVDARATANPSFIFVLPMFETCTGQAPRKALIWERPQRVLLGTVDWRSISRSRPRSRMAPNELFFFCLFPFYNTGTVLISLVFCIAGNRWRRSRGNDPGSSVWLQDHPTTPRLPCLA